MVCASVREDNSRALASGLSPVRAQNHDNLLIAPACICILCIARCLTLNAQQATKYVSK